MNNNNHGGKRKGSGQPKKAPTTILNFRIETAKKAALKLKYGRGLNKLIKAYLDTLLSDNKQIKI